MLGDAWITTSSVLLIYCHFVNVLGVASGTPTTNLYTMVRVPNKLLSDVDNSETVQSESKMNCAIRGNAKPSYRLMCFDNQQCSLYDVLVAPSPAGGGGGDASLSGDERTCWTKLGKVCVIEGTIYQEGETFKKDCKDMICSSNVAKPLVAPGAPETCPSPFAEVENVGCILVFKESKSFDDAAEHCCSLASLLLIPEDFVALQNYLLSLANSDGEYWVGSRERKWLDGREVSSSEWAPTGNIPNGGMTECARMAPRSQSYYLDDRDCSIEFLYICHKK